MSSSQDKRKKAVKVSRQAKEDFKKICEAVGTDNTSGWTALEKKPQKEPMKNIEVMDQFNMTDKQGSFGYASQVTIQS